jgi:light-regulated signal transduction histidine kinase (bacteriophytochrome)
VHGDERLLRVLLENLLGNAWKFTSHEPHAVIEFGSTTENGKSCFYVKDNGAGFDATYVDKLFEPFQRLHSTDEFEGTGIGLATVNRIIRRHNGSVWADARVGEGATISFTLD